MRRNKSLGSNIRISKLEDRYAIVEQQNEIGHKTERAMIKSISTANIYWPKMHIDIANFKNKCEACQKYANIRLKNHPATAFPIDNIFDRWGIDIVGGLPITKQGYHAILIVVEYLTKYAWGFALKTKEASEVAFHILTLICMFGPPNILMSDMGKEFLNNIMNQVCERFKIIRRHTSS